MREIFVDDRMLGRTRDVWRILNHPQKVEENPVLEADRPWEGYLVLQPGTVLYDDEENCFKMWYNTQPNRQKPDVGSYLCYAVSADGIQWEKPDLGQQEFAGSCDNNIVLEGVNWTHCLLRDEEEEDPEKKYKLAYWNRGIHVAFSRDGICWNRHENNPVVPSWASGDTFSVMRDPHSRRYFLFHKTRSGPIRTVSRMVSEDFVHWRDSRRVLAPDNLDPPDTEFYGLSAFPYAGQYLGMLWVYHTYLQTMDIQLVSSRDGLNWQRTAGRKLFMHLVPTNRYRGESFDSHMIYPSSAPAAVGDTLYIYYSGFSVPHNALAADHDGRVGLATLRLDGFCSMNATSCGELLTSQVRAGGKEPVINARVVQLGADPGSGEYGDIFTGCASGRGEIRVEVQDTDGYPVRGFSTEDCIPITGDGTEQEVVWAGARNFAQLKGRWIRLRFVLKNAELFSWSLEDSTGCQ